jgi:hypothetical protein
MYLIKYYVQVMIRDPLDDQGEDALMKKLIDSDTLQIDSHRTVLDPCGNERLPFVSKCPSCTRDQPQTGFSRSDLQRLLDGGYPVEAYCVICDEFWPVSLWQRVTLSERLMSADE